MNIMEELMQKIQESDEFSTMPHVASKVMSMVEDPEVTAADLEKFISVDQVLTAEILKLANSPLYAPRTPIVSLRHAISYLGMANIRSLALMVAIRSLYSSQKDKDVMAALWKHAAASAVVARNLALSLKNVKLNIEEMFTLGLLHDFGKVVLLKFYHDRYHPLVEKVKEGSTNFYSAEKKEFGISHAEVGAMVLSKWGLPIDIVNTVGKHHGEPENEMEALVCLANIFCSSWGYSMVSPEFEVQFFERALELLQIDENKWSKVTEEIRKQLEESSEILGA
ncbi:metal dependent phosphohydrolase [Thermosulfidibacter takaii ABI70S6]|uniref:Metal dependent phosphohydrolase n=1 Tax=Thermosulfidibacter takaii (strain DSM 17441 / JCM 13301 / NBRC 103674 / ABI70S6) TaxID=1298851 RepID=A0A0S3QSZ4_THET7|nr:HDOD domain-containing protein [Thermosulfidibacter takaii]BAT71444.1 metal dependent phosphohydrolase [Thermosulfidibacter takaii ABI70S6]